MENTNRNIDSVIKWVLMVLFIVTIVLQSQNAQSLELIATKVEALEPVVMVECVKEEAPTPEPEPVVEVEPEPEPDPVRIDCPLDDATQQMIYEKCAEYNIDFAFTMAVIYKESSFKPNADSGRSVGLMQINRCNHAWLSEELGLTDFFDPEQNVTAGLYMLHELFEKYDDPHQVLMAYNMGEPGAKNLWKQGTFSSKYSRGVLEVAEAYREEIEERTKT